jgi:predicted MFS family arabinose efflux permease
MFWLYIAAVSLLAIGFADFALIAFHMQKTNLLDPRWIPITYAAAMGIDGLAALAFGRLFDHVGVWAMAASVAIAAAFPIAFLGGLPLALAGIALWGVGIGAQESIMKATVARMVDKSRRATAYGVLNSAWGVAWFAGSAGAGWLYDHSIAGLVGFSIAFQLAAVPVLALVARRSQPPPT